MSKLTDSKSKLNTICVYALVDPDNQQVRYIGKAICPIKRYGQHLAGQSTNNKELEGWLSSLRKMHHTPLLHILEEVEEFQGDNVERIWINKYKSTGLLFNIVHNRVDKYNDIPLAFEIADNEFIL